LATIPVRLEIGQSAIGEFDPGLPPLPPEQLLRLSWTHFIELIRIDDPLKRAFYQVECLQGNWSIRQLQRQIGSLLYERTGLSTDKESVIRRASSQDLPPSIAANRRLQLPHERPHRKQPPLCGNHSDRRRCTTPIHHPILKSLVLSDFYAAAHKPTSTINSNKTNDMKNNEVSEGESDNPKGDPDDETSGEDSLETTEVAKHSKAPAIPSKECFVDDRAWR
jgi:DUF1016 N-terminal domain